MRGRMDAFYLSSRGEQAFLSQQQQDPVSKGDVEAKTPSFASVRGGAGPQPFSRLKQEGNMETQILLDFLFLRRGLGRWGEG